MERRRVVEHKIRVKPDTALCVYCATCCRVLAEYDSHVIGIQAMALALASDHWAAYTEDHQVTVTSLTEKRMQFIHHSNQFHDLSQND